MNRSKEAVRSRRLSAIFSVFGTLGLGYIARGRLVSPPPLHQWRLGSTDSWPTFLQGYWALDLLVAFLGFWLVLRSMFELFEGTDALLRLLVRLGAFAAGFIGVCTSLMLGWLTGLVSMLVAGVSVPLGLALLGALIHIVGRLLRPVPPFVVRIWPRYRLSFLGRPFVRIGHWLNADDVAD